MGRRTVRWYGRALLAAAAALSATCAGVGQAAADGTPTRYAFGQDATTVTGAASSTDSVRIEPGKTYKSSIGRDGKLLLPPRTRRHLERVLSATAVPRLGTAVSYSDGVKVSVQDGNSRKLFLLRNRPLRRHPEPPPHRRLGVARNRGKQYACQTAGTYYVVVVERTGTTDSSTGDWDLELSYVSEPGLKRAGPTSAPEVWDSASPDALSGDPKPRRGGAGFTTASPLRQGIWQDGISPGQTLFYEVPVDWGQQLYVTADLGQFEWRRRRFPWEPPWSCPSTTPYAASSTTSVPDTTAASARPRSIPFLPSRTRTATPSTIASAACGSRARTTSWSISPSRSPTRSAMDPSG